MTQDRRHIERKMKIESRTEVLADVRMFIGDAAREFGFDEDDVINIEIAVDEACTNIIKHAYGNNPNGWIRIDVQGHSGTTTDRFVISITDEGKSFDPSAYKAPHIPKPSPGGLGVFLMKKLMDRVEYATKNNKQNSIRLVKYRPRTPQNR